MAGSTISRRLPTIAVPRILASNSGSSPARASRGGTSLRSKPETVAGEFVGVPSSPRRLPITLLRRSQDSMDPAPLPVSEAVSPLPLPQARKNPERRKTARTTPEGLVYVSFEPDNGGIILNVSEGGLCFNAVAPIPLTGKIRVCFLADSHKVEAECEVAWTDETQRTGGLRFNVLSAAAREQIGNWTKQASADGQPERAVPPLRALSLLDALRVDKDAPPEGSPRPEGLAPEVSGFGRLGAFSRGLATGVLLSTIVGGALLFHAYRRQFGEALIRLGEHFGGKPQLQTTTQTPAQIPVSPAATRPQLHTLSPAPAPTPLLPRATKAQLQTLSPLSQVMVPASAVKPQPQTVSPVPAPIPVPAHEKLQSPPVTDTVKAEPPKLEPMAPVSAVLAGAPVTPTPTPPGTPPTSSPVANQPGELAQPRSVPTGDMHVQQLEARNQPNGNPEDFVELGTGIPLGKYFELGKFRDEPEARMAAARLAQARFHAVVVQKARLWTKSYHVLAGPYGNKYEAEAARRNLTSSGFTPRTLARKSRSLTLISSRSRFDGRFSSIGDVVVSWEPYSPDAIVRFVKSGVVVATVPGKWVNRDIPYVTDAIVYRMAAHGSRTLLEIRFSGASQTLVLGDYARQIVF